MKNVWKTIIAGAVISSILVTSANVEAASYTVQKGDTLTKIAKAHNTTAQQLKQLNKLTGDLIYTNQKLVVASMNHTTSPNKVEEKKTEDNKVEVSKSITHTVVKGDNLTNIAKKYNTTIVLLKQWNKLKTDALFVGQKLTIEQPTSAVAPAIPTKETTKPNTVVKEEIIESTVADKVEAVIEFNETADEKIAKVLASEKEITATISNETASKYGQLLQIAQQSLGIPYKYGGTTIEGFDCSGFVNFVYNAVGIEQTRKSSLMYFEQDTTKVKDPVPGDLVFFKNTFIPNISHMGIYIGNNQFIHAGSTGIAIGDVTTKYWSERFVAFKRLNSIK
ncbi:peptidoglycan endopeptidase [Lysinibacillus sp. 2017]|uniref:C40 family peptidase n=1 Tax=unclassified Lysinibacillus TaxID=2636778 RepID=UPI000D529511|nr:MULTISPECIES: C40 family peptidase [unclassified Lysinibacillus]AWE06368.1 peptidoglycan endopeptidase [Lysinibacillus sp. 2017]TGN31570.1 peptidoglycan endopeptidase [Lysinibacillus sp. S2017]